MADEAGGTRTFQQVSSLLGGTGVLSGQPKSRMEIHDFLLKGLPAEAVTFLVDNFITLQQPASVEKAFGFSVRTFQRRKKADAKRLNLEQSSRVWQFAEILARAISVLGSRQEAEAWMLEPAIALERRRPLDLIPTSEGRRMVEELLERMEYGVYT